MMKFYVNDKIKKSRLNVKKQQQNKKEAPVSNQKKNFPNFGISQQI